MGQSSSTPRVPLAYNDFPTYYPFPRPLSVAPCWSIPMAYHEYLSVRSLVLDCFAFLLHRPVTDLTLVIDCSTTYEGDLKFADKVPIPHEYRATIMINDGKTEYHDALVCSVPYDVVQAVNNDRASIYYILVLRRLHRMVQPLVVKRLEIMKRMEVRGKWVFNGGSLVEVGVDRED